MGKTSLGSTEIARLLASSSLLSELTEEERTALAERVRVVRYAAGEWVLHRGDDGDRMLVVHRGRVKICNTSATGAELLIAIFGPGELVGELALVDGHVRSADVVALEDTEVLILGRDAFREFVIGRPATGLRLMEVLVARLRRTTALVEEAIFLDFPARLARRIRELAERYGRQSDDGIVVEHGLSQQAVADSLGVARETVAKQLSVWRDGGLVSTGRRKIVVHEPELLLYGADET